MNYSIPNRSNKRFALRRKLAVRSFARGMTLIELLAVITIMGILGSMILVAVKGAQQDSLVAKTRTTIQKIHEVIAAKYEGYMTQTMPLKIPSLAFDRIDGVRAISEREMARVKLMALRDLMRLEMPDRPGDIKYLPSQSVDVPVDNVPAIICCRLRETQTTPVNANQYPLGRIPVPAAFLAIRNAVASAHDPTDPSKKKNWDATNANEELLFLIVSQQQIDNASALEMFGASEIGDTDQDSLKEFLDAWGQPIAWIRWPAGYNASMFNLVEPFGKGDQSILDPLDPLMSDIAFDTDFRQFNKEKYKPGHGLFPLIISKGADKRFGIRFSWDGAAATFSQADYEMSGPIQLPNGYTGSQPFYYPDPYYPRFTENLSDLLGATQNAEEISDNITNLDEFGAAL